jgi:glucose/arabinose dehydrogenase
MKMTIVQTATRQVRFLEAALVAIGAILFFQSCKKTVEQPEVLASGAAQVRANPKEADIQLVADNFVSPIGVVVAPDNSKRLFVIDQAGKIWIIKPDGTKAATPFFDVTSRLVTLSPFYDERGLLGFAFHPDYKNNGKFYVYYQLPPRAGGPAAGVAWNNLSRISEFRVSASNANMADMSTEKILFDIDDPQSNHNGGTLAFGPDGYLYISIGDGGAADDVAPGHVDDWYAFNAGGNGQDVEANLFGNVLRIDVNSGNPYGIPPDNPFVGKPGKDEIYAYGFRNPYRFSFDMGGAHRLFLGDAGQSRYEEVDLVTKGGNYGWNVKEGNECFNAAHDLQEVEDCPSVDNFGNKLIDPVIQVNNAANPEGGIATTVIGGNVYRGHAIPGFEGKYIFGTFSQTFTTADGELFMATPAGPGLWPFQEIHLASHPDDIGYFLKGFGQDWDGEIYLTVSRALGPSGTSGKVFKLVPAGQ